MLDSRGDKLRRVNAIYHLEMFPARDAEKRNARGRREGRDASAGWIKKNSEREGEGRKGRTEGSRPPSDLLLGVGALPFILRARDISLYPD